MNWLDEINWNADGLVPAIAQDHKTGRVLMMAWMNREALQLTAQENCGARARSPAMCRSCTSCAWTVMPT